MREGREQRLREDADAGLRRRTFAAVHLDPRHAATRRVFLQHVAAQILVAERDHLVCGVRGHRVSVIDAGLDRQQPDSSALVDQPNRFARRAHARLDLGADLHPFDERAEHGSEKGIAFVPAVVADLVAEEARGHADPDPRARPRCVRHPVNVSACRSIVTAASMCLTPCSATPPLSAGSDRRRPPANGQSSHRRTRRGS